MAKFKKKYSVPPKMFPFGGMLDAAGKYINNKDNYGTVGMGLQGASQAVNMIDSMDGKPSEFGGIASGALSGASMGMAAGPIGAAVGGVIGGGLALLQAEKAKKDEAEAKKKYMQNLTSQNDMMSQQTLRNYASNGVTSAGSYAYGGDLPKTPVKDNGYDIPYIAKNALNAASMLRMVPTPWTQGIGWGATAASTLWDAKDIKDAIDKENYGEAATQAAISGMSLIPGEELIRGASSTAGLTGKAAAKAISGAKKINFLKNAAEGIGSLIDLDDRKATSVSGGYAYGGSLSQYPDGGTLPKRKYAAQTGTINLPHSVKNLATGKAQDMGDELSSILPGVGDVRDVQAVGTDLANRDYTGAAMSTAGMLLPVATAGAVKYGMKKAAPYIPDVYGGIKNAVKELAPETYSRLKNVAGKVETGIQKNRLEKHISKEMKDLSHPEAIKRMEALGIDPYDTEVRPRTTYDIDPEKGSYYSPRDRRINMDFDQAKDLKTRGYNLSPDVIYSHELGHAMQHSRGIGLNSLNMRGVVPTNLDFDMIHLPVDYSKVNNAVKASRDYDYYMDNIRERMPFLREMRQEMLNKKILKKKYAPVTPEHIEKFADMNTGNRITGFADLEDPRTHQRLADWMNRLPAAGIGTVGGAAALKAAGVNNEKQYAYGGELPQYGKGGGIHIKPENRGKFTAYKKRTGKTTAEALHSKDPHVRQMANFARNAAKWHHKGRKKHALGGDIEHQYAYGGVPYVAKDAEDYKNRKQAYNDSLYYYNASLPMHQEALSNRGFRSKEEMTNAELRDFVKKRQEFYPSYANKDKIKPISHTYYDIDSSTGDKQIIANYKKPVQKVLPPEIQQLAYRTPELGESYQPNIPETVQGISPRGYRRERVPSSEPGYGNFPEYGHYENKPYYAMGGYFANGGEPEYEVEQGEMVQGQPQLEEGQQVASDMYEVGGERHENGGTDGAGGERVFSDRMKTSNKKTYAEEAKGFAKQKAKFEAKIPSTNEAISNTGSRMSERMDMKLDELFQEQEMKKQMAMMKMNKGYAMPLSISSSMPPMAYGGNLPKFQGGGGIQYSTTNPYKNYKGNFGVDVRTGLPANTFNRSGQYSGTEYGTANVFLPKGHGLNPYPYGVKVAPDASMYKYDEPTNTGFKFQPGSNQNADLTGLDPNATPYTPNYDAMFGRTGTSSATPTAETSAALNSEGGATKKALATGNGIPWQYIDNLAQGISTANTPQLAKPYYDPAIRMNTTYDINPQLQAARNTRDAMERSINASMPQGGSSAANKQQLFASSLDNQNALYAQKNNIENELKNKEILLNSNINSRNNDKRYAYDVEQTKRRAGIMEDVVDNARNFQKDIYTAARDAKTDARDLENIKQIAMANPNGANYGFRLKAYSDMYSNDPVGLSKEIKRLQTESPNADALPYLLNMQKKLTGK